MAGRPVCLVAPPRAGFRPARPVAVHSFWMRVSVSVTISVPMTASGFDAEQAIAHLRSADAKLAGAIDRVGRLALTIDPAPDVFRALLRAIVYQQLSGKAAATIHARLLSLLMSPELALTPQRLGLFTDDALRAVGLSRPKILAVRDLAERVACGNLPTVADTATMSDEAIIAALTQVRGIGPWTAQMFLIFNLGRPDVLPINDLGILRGYTRVFRPRSPADALMLARRARRWQPYRSAACWYLWQVADEPRPLSTEAARIIEA